MRTRISKTITKPILVYSTNLTVDDLLDLRLALSDLTIVGKLKKSIYRDEIKVVDSKLDSIVCQQR